ncbi:MAG: hypothetical protein LBP40_04765 [Campylobacteraceae bacterium]|jgi:hypothetical protein|nr:hypothetical protein [Campylobacteraceae bacterium]
MKFEKRVETFYGQNDDDYPIFGFAVTYDKREERRLRGFFIPSDKIELNRQKLLKAIYG